MLRFKALQDGVMRGDECSVAVFTCWWSRRDEAPRQDGERSKAYERSDEPAPGPTRIWRRGSYGSPKDAGMAVLQNNRKCCVYIMM